MAHGLAAADEGSGERVPSLDEVRSGVVFRYRRFALTMLRSCAAASKEEHKNMKGLQALVSLVGAVLAALAPGFALAQQVKDKPAIALTTAELFAPHFLDTGSFRVVQLQRPDGNRVLKEKVLREFGAGASQEKQAYSYAATAATSGPGPNVVKRVLKHYRCPERLSDGLGSESDTDCKAVLVGYALPADPTDPNALAECSVTVDADVLYLGRRAKTVKWMLNPPSPPAATHGGAPRQRIRLLEVGSDSSGQEVRGITFSDNTEDPQERGEPPGGTGLVFDAPATAADGQSVVWARSTEPSRRGLAKVFYYAVVLQLWSDALQDYVFCKPYDPTIANRGN